MISSAPLPGRTVGLIGLGMMGVPIAANFIAAGQPLRVRDVSADAMTSFIDHHPGQAEAAGEDGFTGCDLVVLLLPNSDIVDSVCDGPDGLLNQLSNGSYLVDMGSSVPARTKALASRAAERGVHVVDAPISGGVTRAVAADLGIMFGGNDEELEHVRPLLMTTARQIVPVGPVGSGHAAKALNNLLSATGLVAAAEVLLIGRSLGIEPSALLEVINAGTGRNQATESKYAQFILSRTFGSGFSASLMRKDLGIARELADSAGFDSTVTAATAAYWNRAEPTLDRGSDHTAIVTYLEDLAGLELRE